MTEEEEKSHGGLGSAAEERELNAWQKIAAFQPMGERDPSTSIVDIRLALTRKMVNGERDAEVRLVAEGNQGIVRNSGRVSLQSSHHPAIPLGATKKVFGAWSS